MTGIRGGVEADTPTGAAMEQAFPHGLPFGSRRITLKARLRRLRVAARPYKTACRFPNTMTSFKLPLRKPRRSTVTC